MNCPPALHASEDCRLCSGTCEIVDSFTITFVNELSEEVAAVRFDAATFIQETSNPENKPAADGSWVIDVKASLDQAFSLIKVTDESYQGWVSEFPFSPVDIPSIVKVPPAVIADPALFQAHLNRIFGWWGSPHARAQAESAGFELDASGRSVGRRVTFTPRRCVTDLFDDLHAAISSTGGSFLVIHTAEQESRWRIVLVDAGQRPVAMLGASLRSLQEALEVAWRTWDRN